MRNPFQWGRSDGRGAGGHESAPPAYVPSAPPAVGQPTSVPEGPPTGHNLDPEVRATSVRSRLANLATAIDGTRTRPKVDMRKLLLGFGIALIAAGIIDTLLGWYGAAHSAYLFQEIPYLISGGLLGVCLVIGGGSLFVAGWIVRVLHENRRHTVVLVRTIDKLERTLRATTLAQTNGNAGDGPPEATDHSERIGSSSEIGSDQ